MTKAAKIVVLFALGMAACTQLSKSACEQGDWQGIGQRDGALGRDAAWVDRHQESCAKHGITVDTALWEQGRQQGLRLFCTPESQYDLGRSGRRFNEICAAENLPEHRAAYDKGRKYYELTRQIEELEAEISSLRHDRSLPGTGGYGLASLEIFMINMDIDRLKRERRNYERP